MSISSSSNAKNKQACIDNCLSNELALRSEEKLWSLMLIWDVVDFDPVKK